MDKQVCTGKPLFNEKNLGGHLEDYIPDPNNTESFKGRKLEWVPVSKSFKKD